MRAPLSIVVLTARAMRVSRTRSAPIKICPPPPPPLTSTSAVLARCTSSPSIITVPPAMATPSALAADGELRIGTEHLAARGDQEDAAVGAELAEDGRHTAAVDAVQQHVIGF